MQRIVNIIVIFMLATLAAPAFADNPAGALGNCLVDNLNGKERKNLAKWIFLAIAAHPDIKTYSSASPADIQQSDQFVGKLITRLLTVNCPAELKKAHAADPQAVKKAFGLVGRVAMQELMANQNVTQALTNYAKYADLAKIDKILNGK
ncbi:MAG: hypothetical protein GC149_06540 [Gammaproteobacteria bacterium]|nr:hypothetical protein [Gammaproteobacteria bacterium]